MSANKKEIYKIFEKMMTDIAQHDAHKRKQVGPCVYCIDCNLRLYQGKL